MSGTKSLSSLKSMRVFEERVSRGFTRRTRHVKPRGAGKRRGVRLVWSYIPVSQVDLRSSHPHESHGPRGDGGSAVAQRSPLYSTVGLTRFYTTASAYYHGSELNFAGLGRVGDFQPRTNTVHASTFISVFVLYIILVSLAPA